MYFCFRRLATLAPLIVVAAVNAQHLVMPRWESKVLDREFYAEGATAGDINGDKVPDLVSGPFWYAGPTFEQRTAFYAPKPFDPHGYSDNFFAYVEDFNRDNKNDILVVGFPGVAAHWFENPGRESGDWKKHRVLDIVDNESPTFADLTGDGRRELVCSRNGVFGYATPNGEAPTEPWTFHSIADQSAGSRFTHGLGIGDVNGDGRADLLEKSGWWEQPPSLDGDPQWVKHPVEFSGAGGSQMYTTDVDGDGDSDVISALAAHGFGVAWFEQQRQGERIRFERHMIVGSKPAETEYGVVFSQPHAIAVGDLDRDGLLDFVTGKRPWAHGPHGDAEPNAQPVLYWFRGTRTKNAAGTMVAEFVPYQIAEDGGVGVDVQLHDLNDDGALDVVVASKRGTFTHTQRTEKHDSTAPQHTIPHRDAARMKSLDQWPTEGLEPAKAAAQMTVPAGFSVDLIAGEPQLHQPIAFCFDLRGRIWVAEAHTYPTRAPEGEGRDRIVVLEDADKNGSFEKQTTFIEGLNLVSGLEVGFGGVWVGAAPHLMFIPDRNEDLQPDSKPEILLDGWGYQDTHETLNAFTWGPDGWLYGCHGIFTHSKVGRPGTRDADRVPLNAGVWRFHPTKKQFEQFAEGTSNPWGVDFDEYGQALITSCVIPHAFHMIQGARYHRQAGQHFNPYTFQDIKTIADHAHYAGNIADHAWWGRDEAVHDDATSAAGGGHAHCGAMIYLGDNWPQGYRGALFMANVHGNRINCDVLRRDGSGFIASHGDDVLFANDPWFRAIAMKYGPDGAVYFIDWYDKNACHRKQPEIWDRTNGRLYRMRYGDLKPVKAGEHTIARNPGGFFGKLEPLLSLGSENQWTVRAGLRAVRELTASSGKLSSDWQDIRKNLLKDLAGEDWVAMESRQRLTLLWALHAVEAVSDDEALSLLNDQDENVRAWAIQLSLEDRDASESLRQRMTMLAKSESSLRVRLYLASALQRLPLDQRWSMAEALLSHVDSQFDQNLPLVLWYGVEPLVPGDPQRALRMANAVGIPLVRQFIYRRVAADPKLVTHLVDAIADSSEADQQQLMLSELRGSAEKLGRVAMPTRWPEVVSKLSQHEKLPIRQAVQFLSISYGDRSMFPLLRQMVADTQQATTGRQQALAALDQGKDDQLGSLALSLLDDVNMRLAAVELLGKVEQQDATEAILTRYSQWPSELKSMAMNSLVSRAVYARGLLAAMGRGTFARSELTAVHVGKIQQLGDPQLIEQLSQVWGTTRVTPEETRRLIQSLKQQHPSSKLALADRQHGRSLFVKACGTCHRLFGEGAELGPDLTGANRSSLDYLLENIVDPNAVVGKDYQTVSILTDDGRVISGLVREQSDAAIVLHDSQKLVTIPRSEIESLTPTQKSLMPDGLLKPLSADEIAQLLAYLQSPSQVALPGEIPSIDATSGRVPGALEAEKLVAVPTGGTAAPQAMGGFKASRWSGNAQLWWTRAKPNDRLDITFEVSNTGTYELFLVATKAQDYGIFQFTVDDQPPSGPVDFFHRPEVITSNPISLGKHPLKSGMHRLRVSVVGSNPKAAPGYMFGLDFLYLK